jgi:hypothetical protein
MNFKMEKNPSTDFYEYLDPKLFEDNDFHLN